MVQNISSNGGCGPNIIAKVGNRIFAIVLTNNYGSEIWVAQSGTTTNLSTINRLNPLRVYPNPANVQTVVEFPVLTKNNTWHFYNSNGQLLQSGIAKAGSNKLSIDISTFPKGIYVFKIKLSQSGTVVKKIIKQ